MRVRSYTDGSEKLQNLRLNCGYVCQYNIMLLVLLIEFDVFRLKYKGFTGKWLRFFYPYTLKSLYGTDAELSSQELGLP